jgi:hypothetical protein
MRFFGYLFLAWAILQGGIVFGEIPAGDCQDIFQKGANGWGWNYITARDLICNEGQAVLPFLSSKENSPDWRERIFARLLILRIQDPQSYQQQAELLKKELRPYLNNLKNAPCEPTEVRPNPSGGNRPHFFTCDKTSWHIHREAVGVPWPVLADLLHEKIHDDDVYLVVLEFYLSPREELILPLIDAYPLLPLRIQASGILPESIAQLGTDIIPLVREHLAKIKIESCPIPESVSQPQQRLLLMSFREKMYKIDFLSQILAALHDTDSAHQILAALEPLDTYDSDLRRLWRVHLCHNLAAMKNIQVIDTILGWVLQSAHDYKKQWDNAASEEFYRENLVLQRCLTSIGHDVLPAIEKRKKESADPVDQIVLQALVLELSDSSESEKKAAMLREKMYFVPDMEGLIQLYTLTGEDVSDQFSRLPAYEHYDYEKTLILIDGAERIKTPAMAEMLWNAVQQYHELYQMDQLPPGEQGKKQNRETMVKLKALERSHLAFRLPDGPQDTRYFEMWADEKEFAIRRLLAIFRMKDPRAREWFKIASEYPQIGKTAEFLILELDGKREELAARLKDTDPAVREAAAVVLCEVGDSRCQPELLRSMARYKKKYHPSRLTWAAKFDELLPAALEELRHSENVRERVLAIKILFERKEPGKVKTFEYQLTQTANSIGAMHVFFIDDIEGAGRGWVRNGYSMYPGTGMGGMGGGPGMMGSPQGLMGPGMGFGGAASAEQPKNNLQQPPMLDESYIPLFEYECLFGQETICRGICAFALGEFKKERSKAVLEESLDMGGINNPKSRTMDNPAAKALASFETEEPQRQ